MNNDKIINEACVASDLVNEGNEREITLAHWVETTSERYWEMLEVLPPEIMLNGGFLVGEPVTHRTCKLTGLCKPTFDGFKSVIIDGVEMFYATSEDVTVPEFKLLIGGK